MDPAVLSERYQVRRLTEADVEAIYRLCAEIRSFTNTARPLSPGRASGPTAGRCRRGKPWQTSTISAIFKGASWRRCWI